MAMLLGMSLSLAGIGGLLSGVFSHSLLRALLWAAGFGMLETFLIIMTATSWQLAPVFIPLALFWGLVGWLAIGRIRQRRRRAVIASGATPD